MRVFTNHTPAEKKAIFYSNIGSFEKHYDKKILPFESENKWEAYLCTLMMRKAPSLLKADYVEYLYEAMRDGDSTNVIAIKNAYAKESNNGQLHAKLLFIAFYNRDIAMIHTVIDDIPNEQNRLYGYYFKALHDVTGLSKRWKQINDTPRVLLSPLSALFLPAKADEPNIVAIIELVKSLGVDIRALMHLDLSHTLLSTILLYGTSSLSLTDIRCYLRCFDHLFDIVAWESFDIANYLNQMSCHRTQALKGRSLLHYIHYSEQYLNGDTEKDFVTRRDAFISDESVPSWFFNRGAVMVPGDHTVKLVVEHELQGFTNAYCNVELNSHELLNSLLILELTYNGLSLATNREKLLSMLLRGGLDLHKVDDYGRNCLFTAALGTVCSTSMFMFMIEHGADINAALSMTEREAGMSVLTACIRNNRLPFVLLLLKHGVETKNQEGVESISEALAVSKRRSTNGFSGSKFLTPHLHEEMKSLLIEHGLLGNTALELGGNAAIEPTHNRTYGTIAVHENIKKYNFSFFAKLRDKATYDNCEVGESTPLLSLHQSRSS